ncbi:MAG: serine/threonine-protein kinase, partial [Isosphaeraceae bacterium]
MDAIPDDQSRRDLALGLAQIDLDNRLRMGEAALVGDYVGRFPGVVFGVEELRELVRIEYVGRLFKGEDPPVDSYKERFPDVWVKELDTELSGLRAEPVNDPHVPRYRIISPHRSGGLGCVFLAFDRELRRRVALKELTGVDDNSRAAERTRREAEVTAQLDYQGIVSVHSSDRWPDGRPYYVMRFVPGPTFAQEICRLHNRPSPPVAERAAELRTLLDRFIDACQAVAYAHDRRVVHLDLKPNNILLGPYDETVVVDWGSARRLDQPVDSVFSLGTPCYMSPEQADNRLDQLDEKTDIFNLGATLYHLLTGRAPFDSASAPRGEEGTIRAASEGGATAAEQGIRRRASAGEFVGPRQLIPNISKALEAICLNAMARDPGERYQSAQELVRDLKQWLAGEPISAWREPLWMRVLRWIRRHRTLASILATIIVISFFSVLAGIAVERGRLQKVVNDVTIEAATLAEKGRFGEAADKLTKALQELRRKPGSRGELGG